MPFSLGAAIGAGIAGTAVMTGLLYMGIAMMPRQMTMNILYMYGSMMTRAKVPAYVIGAMVHIGLGTLFAIIHTSLYAGLDLETNLAAWGLLFGFVHWMAAGMMLAMVGPMHPLMRSGELAAPGAFALKFPAFTVVGFLMLHLVYGVVVGSLYEAWA